jgi:hypothetical protein
MAILLFQHRLLALIESPTRVQGDPNGQPLLFVTFYMFPMQEEFLPLRQKDSKQAEPGKGNSTEDLIVVLDLF